MSTIHTACTRLCAMFFVLLFCSTAFGGPVKVDVCHIPPSDPENFHTIRINENALPSHLAHGDLEGACVVQSCPCFTQAQLDELTPAGCMSNEGESFAFFGGATACSGDGSLFGCTDITPGCALTGDNVVDITLQGISDEDDEACRSIIFESCNPSTLP